LPADEGKKLREILERAISGASLLAALATALVLPRAGVAARRHEPLGL
jgi:hypothetical protein